MNRTDLQLIAQLRLAESHALIELGHYSGAYYLAGYAVECGLKACIARRTQLHDFPDLVTVRESYTHNLAKLVNASNLAHDLNSLAMADAQFSLNWTLVKDWSEESRYRLHEETDARALVAAIADESHGVMQWIRRHW